jgi:filamentous hemagglutinin family protein
MLKKYSLILLFVSSFAAAFNGFSILAKGNPVGIYPDGTTQTDIAGNAHCLAECTISGSSRMGNNLFHSFSEFNIPANVTVTFTDSGAANIFTKVSGSPSSIDGTLVVTGNGQANFFFINPHGITFGPHATLISAGSFVASTADSIVFSEGVLFGATETAPPLLTLNTPVGFQFGLTPGDITSHAQFGTADTYNIFGESAGLQVSERKTLALIGNGLFLEGGNLTASSGQLVLGSVGANSTVSFASDFTFGYNNVSTFADIHLDQGATLDSSGEQGRIVIRGRNLTLTDGAFIANFTVGDSLAGSIEIVSDTSIEINRAGIIFSPFFDNSGDSSGDGADVAISTGRLTLKEGAIISGGTFGLGNGGNLAINASESIELIGINSPVPTLITTSTEGIGSGGNITIDTQQLRLTDGAQIQTVTYGPGQGGNLTVNATQRVDVMGINPFSGGLASGLLASSGIEGLPFQPTGAGGSLSINTGVLAISDRAQVAVNSLGSGDAGNLNIKARSVRLDNQAQLTASAAFGNGGNLRLENLETLVLRRGSLVSTRAGVGDGQGNGGNIFIDADFIIAGLLEDSDIVAKATQGHGGNIEIHTRGLHGIEQRRAVANNETNDIDASSEFGVSGIAEINQPILEADPGWLALSDQTIEATASVSSKCEATGNRFVVTTRGGIPIRPSEGVESGLSLVDLGTDSSTDSGMDYEKGIPERITANREEKENDIFDPHSEHPLAWVEANSWILNEKDQVVLTAQPQQNDSLPQRVAATCSG